MATKKTTAKKETEITISGFKGFDKDLKCRDFQYKEGETFELPINKKLVCCDINDEQKEGGFHFCENPLDIFSYYPPNGNKYHEVTSHGEVKKHSSDSKVACSKLTIGAEISLNKIIEGGIKFIFERVKWTKENTTTGDNTGATSNGNRSGATSNGNSSGATSNGYSSGATSNGYSSGATSNGYSSGATSNGYSSGATSNGDRSGATSNGYSSGATSNGDRSGATSNGNRSGATSNGDSSFASAVKGGIATAIGKDCKVKGSIGAWLTIVEGDYDSNNEFYIKDAKLVIVDGKKIKADTFYQLINSKIVELK